MTTIISLIGEQNVPNLLPILHLNPDRVILVYTDFTKKTAARLRRLIEDKTDVILISVDAYNIEQTRIALLGTIQPFLPTDILINFTGGTKMMSLAAYQTAIELKSSIFYVQSQGKKTLLYIYAHENGRYPLQKTEEIPSSITISDYLDAYLDDYKIIGIADSTDRGYQFERAVLNALKPVVDEVCAGVKMRNTVDIDFIVRCGNLVGIIETKATLKNTKKGIDQLNTAGGRDYLGTYTQKFFVCDQTWGKNLEDLKQIATDRHIKIIELPSFNRNDALSATDTAKLQTIIRKKLGCAN